MTRRVLIIGGGIAGPVTAMALRKAGFEPVVFEAYERGAEGIGAFLTLAPNGIAALDLLDLGQTVAGLGMDTPHMVLLNGNGRVLARVPSPSVTVKRGDVYVALRDEAVRRGIPIEYGKRLTGAENAGRGVRASFADGTTAEGDLLIGADGLHSRVRAIIDPGTPRPRYLGLLNTGGFAKDVAVPGEPGVAYFMFGRRCFFGYVIHPSGEVWWFANPGAKREPSAPIGADTWRERLRELFKVDAGPAVSIIDATEEILGPWSTHDFPTVPKWRNDRMVVIGDAAHATSPASGQGASMAIEDSVVLATSLRDNADTAAALAAYEHARRARVEKVVAIGKRNGSQKAPGPIGRAIRDLMLPIVMPRVARSKTLRGMYEYRVSWR